MLQKIFHEHRIRTLLPLLVAAAFVVGANGLLFTVVAVRASQEGWSVTTIGIMSALFSVGFAVGCGSFARLLSFSSHRALFSILVIGSAIATASMALATDPLFWNLTRLLSGFAYAGLLALIESSINANVSNSHRARALSLYRVVSLVSVSLAQLVIPLAGIEGHAIFLIVALTLMTSLLPLAVFGPTDPVGAASWKPQLLATWRTSPLASLGAFAAGLTVTTFRSTGAVYAHVLGLSPSEIATFMSAGLIGGLVLQYPLSMISDRFNRIAVIALTMMGACLSELGIAAFAGESVSVNTAGIVIFSAFSFPLYALSAAHGNDRASMKGGYVMFAAALLFFTSLGGTVGPLVVSPMMDRYGANGFLFYMLAVHGSMAVYASCTLFHRRAGVGRHSG